LRASSPSRTAPSSPARSTVYVWRIVESDNARTGSASSVGPGLVLARIASTSASTSDGRSLSSGIAPKGAGSRCRRDRFAYSARVDSLRSLTASVVARQCARQSQPIGWRPSPARRTRGARGRPSFWRGPLAPSARRTTPAGAGRCRGRRRLAAPPTCRLPAGRRCPRRSLVSPLLHLLLALGHFRFLRQERWVGLSTSLDIPRGGPLAHVERSRDGLHGTVVEVVAV
jgi:hypothetical protein